MKKWALWSLLVFAVLVAASLALAGANVLNYNEPGGARTVIGGSLDVVSGGDLDVESGASLKLAGTAITATAAEINKMDGVTATYAEINYIDIATPGTVEASRAVVVNSNKDATGFRYLGATALNTTGNVGTPNTGATAAEYGDGYRHITVLTVSMTLPAITGGVDQGLGKLLYTLPAGACVIHSARMNLAVTQSQGNINADTPDVGLGTTIASGAVNVLSGTAAFEDILTGQAAADCNGTATDKTLTPTAAIPLVIESGDAHTIHFNLADGFAAGGDAAATLTGTVVIEWTFLGS